jgi:hypothetical protein
MIFFIPAAMAAFFSSFSFVRMSAWISEAVGFYIVDGLLVSFYSFFDSTVGKAASLLGMSSVTVVGLDKLSDHFKDELMSLANGLPAAVLQIMGIMQLDVAFSLILSAGVIRLALRGLNTKTNSITLLK